jgi:hypothetical protein
VNGRVVAYPMNGLAVYTIIGVDSSDFANISPTVPPATDKNAEPARPSRNRATNMVVMLFANAHGIIQTMKKANEMMYMGRLP